jgi:predicted ATP-dependent endonuclease of OLD family
VKVESISIQNFKRFDRLEVSFKNKTLDEVSDRFLFLGDNGSGKTTFLQAITLPTSAWKRLPNPLVQDVSKTICAAVQGNAHADWRKSFLKSIASLWCDRTE